MRRANIFRLNPNKEQEEELFRLCKLSAVLWNRVNYKRRQSFFSGKMDWDVRDLYDDFKKILGSATAQQIIRKNDEAWRSFLRLKTLKRQRRLPEYVEEVSPPRYWKDRKTGKKKLMTVIRNDCYRLETNSKGRRYLILPKGLRIRVNGKIRWHGKQGRLEIHHDDLTGRWYAHQSVESEKPKAKGNRRAYADLGVINIVTVWIEGEGQAIAFSGRALLSDWWYWNKRIAECQSKLKVVNGKHPSRKLRKLYRRRQGRFKNAVNTIVYRFVRLCSEKGVNEIVVGDVTHIRENSNKSKKFNSMIHNFWSFRYILERLKATAENFGIKVRLVKEYKTSSTCP